MQNYRLLVLFYMIIFNGSILASDQSMTAKNALFHFNVAWGQRLEELKWSIAGQGVNVLSELHWQNIASASYRFDVELKIKSKIKLVAFYGAAGILSGSIRDSDYCKSNRQNEFSRSIVDANGSSQDLGIGLRFDLLQQELASFRSQLRGSIGLGRQQQNFRMNVGQQVVSAADIPCDFTIEPNAGPPRAGAQLRGLNSSYDSRWAGPWFGLLGQISAPKLSLTTQLKLHIATAYEGVGRWRQRYLTFVQSATGWGAQLGIALGYRIRPQLTLGLRTRYYRFLTGRGDEFIEFSDASTCNDAGDSACFAPGAFNAAKWQAWSAEITIQYSHESKH